MNILMVGHSGAGKTSFMAGLYKCCGEDTENYGIKAMNESQKRQLKKLAKGLSKGKYPAGTDVQQQYEFFFTVGGSEVMPFNWIDYRGGILLSEDPDESDMDKFMKAIASADALVVFLDGLKLIEKNSRWNMEYDILISCIENSLSVSHKSWFPISFVITKCDTLPDNAKFYGLSRFNALLQQIDQNEDVYAMLLQCAVTPDFCHLPFFVLAFSILGGAPIYQRRCADAYEVALRRAESHRPTSIIGKIFAAGEVILNGIEGMFEMEREK